VKPKGRKADATPHELAVRLASLLPEPNALIGALAVAAHGYIRATDDIDFVSTAEPKEIQARLAKAGIASKIRRGDVLEGDIPSVVYGRADGFRFDVLFPPVPIDWSRTVVLPLSEGSRLRVVDLDALVRLKLRAGGPQDLIDVVHLVRLHREIEERALALAEAYGVRDRLEEWLADPRIRSSEPVAPRHRPGRRSRAPARRRRP
jgi:hypothetical protein